MGGGKRKYNQKETFRKFHAKPVEVKEEKKEAPKEEDVKSLIDLWQSQKKKTEETKQ